MTTPTPTAAVYEPPPPPRKRPERESSIPAFSIRIDPINWLLYGELPFELESQIWRFVSFEVTPIFVTTEQPPLMRQSSQSELKQSSNGIGALAGAAIGPGFWLSGRPNRGTVLRAIFTNYAYSYSAIDGGDSVSHTERRIYGYLGSHSRWGIFTIASGFGIGTELNRQRRCFDARGYATTNCGTDELLIALPSGLYDLHSWTYPVELLFRFSLGVSFD